jgi:hypothetical protein
MELNTKIAKKGLQADELRAQRPLLRGRMGILTLRRE